ncbi:hypothetical protein [Ideonella margarita]|uniref:DUF5060 domain-containing protein n=1 Tax=Ideonella margarita TaxID=2984191 RepID=A0ABU9C2S8_9BURK
MTDALNPPLMPRRALMGAAMSVANAVLGASALGAGPAVGGSLAQPGVAPELPWAGPVRHAGGWLEWSRPTPSSVSPAAWFDPDQHDVWCDFEGPGGAHLRATAFWHNDARQGGRWLLRLFPTVPGRWQGTVQGSIGGGAPQDLGRVPAADVARVPRHHHISLDASNPRYFAFEDGTPHVPVGLNICWGMSDDTLADYRRWFTRLAAQGGNFARLWMASWSFGIEWVDTGLGNYARRMTQAELLDEVFALAESLGIKLMLCLVNHGAFSENADSEWARNPYNQRLGGPLATPDTFVTDEVAQRLFERRVRYIAARWSHSPALHSWEWWNEVTWTPIRAAELRPWIARMSRVLDRHDPYRRLRTTSWADRGDATTWQMQQLDFVQQHDYTLNDPIDHYAASARAWEADGLAHKPWVPGELGLETEYDIATPRPFEADAVHLHNGLWAPLFLGYASTAWYWWWDKMVDPQRRWSAYRGVSRFLDQLHGSGLRLSAHRPHPPQQAQLMSPQLPAGGEPASGVPPMAASPDARALAMVGARSALVWVRAHLHDASALRRAWRQETGGKHPAQPWTPRYPLLKQHRVVLDALALPDGPVRVRWLDPATGHAMAPLPTPAVCRGGTLVLAVPAFQRDLVAIVMAAHA